MVTVDQTSHNVNTNRGQTNTQTNNYIIEIRSFPLIFLAAMQSSTVYATVVNVSLYLVDSRSVCFTRQ